MVKLNTYQKGDYLTFKDEAEKQQVMNDVRWWRAQHNKVIYRGKEP